MEQRGSDEMVTCYDVRDGSLKWWHSVQTRHSTLAGGVGPRATPTIHDGKVYTLGATGILSCLDGSSGREIWSHNLLERIGVDANQDMAAIEWGRAASPLIVDQKVVVPLGGPALGPFTTLIAFDKDDGAVLWEGGDCQASYSSPCLAELAGVRQILIVCQDYVCGHDPERGRMLWSYPWPGNSTSDANVTQPAVVSDRRILLTKGYGGGAKLLELSRTGQAWDVREVWKDWRLLKTKFANVALLDGFVYGLSDGILECVDLEQGNRRWKDGRYGHGQVLGVGDLLVIMSESGEVALVEARPDAYNQLGSFQALEGKTWNNPCLWGRFLLVRNAQEAACFQLP
jgi:outer membrane protein assembly factor BamB